MEQNFQEQTSRFGCYFLWTVLGTARKGSCLIIFGVKQFPLMEITALVDFMQEHKANCKAYYHVEKSLAHYGKVDSLAPAGAMQDFVDYVQEQEREEADNFFQYLHKALGEAQADVQVIYSEQEKEHIVQEAKDLFSKIFVLSPQHRP